MSRILTTVLTMVIGMGTMAAGIGWMLIAHLKLIPQPMPDGLFKVYAMVALVGASVSVTCFARILRAVR